MNLFCIPRALPLLAMALLASSAHGQDRLLAPLQASAAVPPAPYHSAFADYRSNLDPQPVAWRTVNDTVTHTGGHAGHAMGAAKPAAPASATPPGHAGHSMGPAKPATPASAIPPAPDPAKPKPKPKPATATEPAHQHHHKE